MTVYAKGPGPNEANMDAVRLGFSCWGWQVSHGDRLVSEGRFLPPLRNCREILACWRPASDRSCAVSPIPVGRVWGKS